MSNDLYLERYSVKDNLVKHIKSSLFEENEHGTWCYYDDVIQIISKRDRQIEELKRQIETLKVERLENKRWVGKPEWVTDELRNSLTYRRGKTDREYGHPPAEATLEYLAGYGEL